MLLTKKNNEINPIMVSEDNSDPKASEENLHTAKSAVVFFILSVDASRKYHTKKEQSVKKNEVAVRVKGIKV